MVFTVTVHYVATKHARIKVFLCSVHNWRAKECSGLVSPQFYFWIPPMLSVGAEGTWSDSVLMVIGAPTMTVDAQPVSRLAVSPNSADPEFKLQPGGFPGSLETNWTILAGTIAASTCVILSTG
jgi:hypothetical protein